MKEGFYFPVRFPQLTVFIAIPTGAEAFFYIGELEEKDLGAGFISHSGCSSSSPTTCHENCFLKILVKNFRDICAKKPMNEYKLCWCFFP